MIHKLLSLLFVLMLVVSCKKDDPNDNVNIVDNCEGFMTSTVEVDGEYFCYFIQPNGGFLSGPSAGGEIDIQNNLCVFGYEVGVGYTEGFDVAGYIEFYFDRFFTGTCDHDSNEAENFEQLFALGSYNYASENEIPKGVRIILYHNEEEWQSELGEQNGSNFRITSAVSASPVYDFTNSGAALEGTFNCKVYNSSGESLELKDGKFQVVVESFFSN